MQSHPTQVDAWEIDEGYDVLDQQALDRATDPQRLTNPIAPYDTPGDRLPPGDYGSVDRYQRWDRACDGLVAAYGNFGHGEAFDDKIQRICSLNPVKGFQLTTGASCAPGRSRLIFSGPP